MIFVKRLGLGIVIGLLIGAVSLLYIVRDLPQIVADASGLVGLLLGYREERA